MRRTFPILLALLLLPVGLAWSEDEAPAPKKGAGDEALAEAQAALDAMMKELRAEAARIRGLAWKSEVPGRMIRRADIAPSFAQEVEHFMPRAKRERYTRALRRLGLLGPDEKPFELMGSMMAGMAGGFYSPRAKELFVVEGFAGDGARPVLLHELVHALEDQHFDYQSKTLPIAMDPDRAFAATCIVEGSAEYARVQYQAANPAAAAAFMRQSADPAQAQKQMQILQTVPAWMIAPTMMHYRYGPMLVARAMREAPEKDYKTVIAELFAAGPVSAEQVLHLDRWFTDKRDYPRGILWAGDLTEALGRGWEPLYEQRMGELALALYLDRYLGSTNGKLNVPAFMTGIPATDRAKKAAEGWDGGRLLFLSKGAEPIVMIQAWVFDTKDDAAEAGEALLDALKAQHGDAWKAKDWSATAPGLGRPFATRTLTYEGRFGPGRIAIRHDQVVIVDGAPAASLETIWKWALKTRFLRDDRDTWQSK